MMGGHSKDPSAPTSLQHAEKFAIARDSEPLLPSARLLAEPLLRLRLWFVPPLSYVAYSAVAHARSLPRTLHPFFLPSHSSPLSSLSADPLS